MHYLDSIMHCTLNRARCLKSFLPTFRDAIMQWLMVRRTASDILRGSHVDVRNGMCVIGCPCPRGHVGDQESSGNYNQHHRLQPHNHIMQSLIITLTPKSVTSASHVYVTSLEPCQTPTNARWRGTFVCNFSSLLHPESRKAPQLSCPFRIPAVVFPHKAWSTRIARNSRTFARSVGDDW